MTKDKIVLFFYCSNTNELKILLSNARLPLSLGDGSFIFVRDENQSRHFANKYQSTWVDLFSCEQFEEGEGQLVLSALGRLYSFMGQENSVIAGEKYLPHVLLKSEIKDEVTFFGGSFNPWHDGHRACLDLCPETHIVIVPDSSPWKAVQKEECFFKAFIELAMSLKCSSYSLFPGFYGLSQSNPTVSWLPKVAVTRKNLLMGDDSFISFPQWMSAVDLAKSLNKIYVVPRWERREENLAVTKILANWNSDLEVVNLPDHEYKTLSSTTLRK